MNHKNNYNYSNPNSSVKEANTIDHKVEIRKDKVSDNGKFKFSSLSILFNWKVLVTLLFVLFFSFLESYFSILVRFNTNTAFNSSETTDPSSKDKNKFFYLIVDKWEIGNVKNSRWSLQLFKLTSASFFMKELSNFLFSLFNKELAKFSKDAVLLKLKNSRLSNDEKIKQKQLTEKDFSEKTNAFSALIISVVQLCFEAWFFWYSILKKELESGLLIGRLKASVVLIVLFYLTQRALLLASSKISFLNENKSQKPLLTEPSVFSKETFSITRTFPSSFPFIYYLAFAQLDEITKKSLKKKPLSPGSYVSLRIDSVLFALYSAGFIRKIANFINCCYLFKNVYFTKKTNYQKTA